MTDMSLPTPANRFKGLVALLRPKQWIKNGFVLAPLVFSGAFRNTASIGWSLLAMVMFCIASSAVYIVNDMNDVDRDRRHPKKSLTRPLAAGVVSMQMAKILLAGLYVLLFLGCFILPKMLLVIGAYILLNFAYTFALKDQPVLDIFCIAIGFVLRVYAGAVALAVPVSSWMFVTTLCLALYLAAVKRRQELKFSGTEGRKVLEGYSVELVDRYAEMSATGALVFYAMFVMSDRPELVISIPLVLFGLFRYWYVVEQKDAGESPTDALMADAQLLITVVLWVIVCAVALLSTAN